MRCGDVDVGEREKLIIRFLLEVQVDDMALNNIGQIHGKEWRR